VEASDDPVIERQRRLGQALAEWRKQAELNQAQLADAGHVAAARLVHKQILSHSSPS